MLSFLFSNCFIGLQENYAIESIYLLVNRPSSGSLRKESIAHTFCLLPTEPVSIRWNPSKRQWCQTPTKVSQSSESGAETIVGSLHNWNSPVYVVQHCITALKRWRCGVRHLHRCTVPWVRCQNYCGLIVELRLSCVLTSRPADVCVW